MKVWGVKGSLENLRKLIQCCQMLKIITRVLGSWLSGRQSRWSVAMCREWWIWWWIVSHIVKEAWKAEMGGWRWFVRLLGKDEVTMVVVEEKGGGRRIATRKMERWKDFHSRQLNCSVQSQEDLFLSNGLIMIMVLVLVLMILTSGEGWGRTDAVLLPRLGDRSHLEVSAWSRFKLFASNQVAFQTFFKRGF